MAVTGCEERSRGGASDAGTNGGKGATETAHSSPLKSQQAIFAAQGLGEAMMQRKGN